MLYNINYVITYVVLYNMSHIMLYNMGHVMLYNIKPSYVIQHVSLCYITISCYVI